MIRDAMHAFLDKKILERVGFAERGDLVRVPAKSAGGEAGVGVPSHVVTPGSTTASAASIATASVAGATDRGADGASAASAKLADAEPGSGAIPDGIITTETEVAVFEYVRRRLPFLIERDETLYQKLDHLYPRDFKTRFTVCYRQDRNGRLFNFMEMAQGPRYRIEFPDSGAVLNTDSLQDIDSELLSAFLKRVDELG